MTPALKQQNSQQKEVRQVAQVAQKAAETKLIEATIRIQKFSGPNGAIYEFDQGDQAEVPASVADLLVKRGKAKYVVEEEPEEQEEAQEPEAPAAPAPQAKKITKSAAKEEKKPADPTFGLDSEEGIILTGKANSLSSMIRRMCVPTNGKEALINPLPLRIGGNRIETQGNSRFKGLAVFGGFQVDHQGEGEVCIDPVEMQSFLDLYGDQHVAVHFSPEGHITVQGERRSSNFYALAEEPPFYNPTYTESKDGHATFKNGKKTEWVAVVKAKEISEAASPSNLLGVKTWTLIADNEGLTVSIGSVEGKGRTVRTRVPAVFGQAKSKPCGSEFGEDFGTLMNIIDGDVQIATGGDAPEGGSKMPAVIHCGPLTYVVMPRKNQAEDETPAEPTEE